MSIEISESVLNYGLTFLAVSSGIMLAVVLGFLAKLLCDCSKLAQNASKTTEIVNSELKPTLTELNTVLKSFNKIVQNTGEGVGNVKLGLENILSKTKLLSGNLMSGFLKGFLAVYSLFGKKK
ncbi:MAG: hypothetical protein SPL73_06585 [Cyanobacteriota bacterium]|nr:hypothetical protein [Cyanobacteriota bacterium]